MLIEYIGVFAVLFLILYAFYRRLRWLMPHFRRGAPARKVVHENLRTYVCLECGAIQISYEIPVCTDEEHVSPIRMVLFDHRREAEYALMRNNRKGTVDEPVHQLPPQAGRADSAEPGEHLLVCPSCFMTARGEIRKFCPNHGGEAPILMNWGNEAEAQLYTLLQQAVTPDTDSILPPPDDR